MIGKHAVWAVNALRQQNMVASFEQRQMDERDRTLSAGSNDGAKTLFQFAHFGREFQRGWRPIKAVGVANLMLVPMIAGHSRARKQHGGSTINRRGERAKALRHLRIRMNQLGLPVFLVRHIEIVACRTAAKRILKEKNKDKAGLRAEPAASGAEDLNHDRLNSQAGWSEAT